MSSNQEQTHGTFLANFKRLVARCQRLTTYNPGNPDISIASLQTALANAEALAQRLISADNNTQITANTRRDLFLKLLPFATRLVNDFASFNVSKKEIKDARSFVKKISGQTSTRKKKTITQNTTTNTENTPAASTTPTNTQNTPAASTTTNISQTTNTPTTTTTTTNQSTDPTKKDDTAKSTSNRSYPELALHFNKLVDYLFNGLINGTSQIYNPTKIEYQHLQLQQFAQSLHDANENCDFAEDEVKNARAARDKKFYSDDNDSIYSLATRVKQYIRGQFPPNSAIVNFASPLPFIRP